MGTLAKLFDPSTPWGYYLLGVAIAVTAGLILWRRSSSHVSSVRQSARGNGNTQTIGSSHAETSVEPARVQQKVQGTNNVQLVNSNNNTIFAGEGHGTYPDRLHQALKARDYWTAGNVVAAMAQMQTVSEAYQITFDTRCPTRFSIIPKQSPANVTGRLRVEIEYVVPKAFEECSNFHTMLALSSVRQQDITLDPISMRVFAGNELVEEYHHENPPAGRRQQVSLEAEEASVESLQNVQLERSTMRIPAPDPPPEEPCTIEFGGGVIIPICLRLINIEPSSEGIIYTLGTAVADSPIGFTLSVKLSGDGSESTLVNQLTLSFAKSASAFQRRLVCRGFLALIDDKEIMVRHGRSGRPIYAGSGYRGDLNRDAVDRAARLWDAMSLIEQSLHTAFEYPECISADDAETALMIAAIIRCGSASLPPAKVQIEFRMALDQYEAHREELTTYREFASAIADNAPLTLFGRAVDLGPSTVLARRMRLAGSVRVEGDLAILPLAALEPVLRVATQYCRDDALLGECSQHVNQLVART